MKNLYLFFAVGSLSIISALTPSCSTNTGDPARDARGRAVNQALAEAGTVLGRTVVSTLFEVAKQEADGGKSDWQQAAVQGLYSNIDVAKTGEAVKRVVLAYSDGKAPDTAQAAQDAFTEAVVNKNPAKVNEAIAGVISTATGAPVVTY